MSNSRKSYLVCKIHASEVDFALPAMVNDVDMYRADSKVSFLCNPSHRFEKPNFRKMRLKFL